MLFGSGLLVARDSDNSKGNQMAISDIQAMINKRADERLAKELEAAWQSFAPWKDDEKGHSVKLALKDGQPESMWYKGGLLHQIIEQLSERFREIYRSIESAKFVAEVTAMKSRFEELTGEELQS